MQIRQGEQDSSWRIWLPTLREEMRLVSHMKISEAVKVLTALAPQDVSSAKTSPYVSVAGVGRILAHAFSAALGAGKKLTVQFMEAKSATGTGAKALGDPISVVVDAGGAATVQAEILTSDLDINNGYTHVAVQVSSDNGSAVQGAAVLVLGDLSFRP